MGTRTGKGGDSGFVEVVEKGGYMYLVMVFAIVFSVVR
jgi:hypothetical protein